VIETTIVVIILASGAGLAELLNDYIDRHSDLYQQVKKLGPVPISGGSGVAYLGGLKKKEVMISAAALICVTLGAAVLLNRYVIGLVVLGLILALGYSLEPLKLKSRGVWGLLALALGRGFVSFHIGWAAISVPNIKSAVAAIFLSLLCFGTATCSYLADFPEDKKLGIRTFPVQVGFRNARLIAAGSMIGSLVVVTCAQLRLPIKVNLLFLPLAVIVISLALLVARTGVDDIGTVSKLHVLGMLAFALAPLVLL